VLNEKNRGQELNNAATFETELIALSVPQISSGTKLGEYKKLEA
jgi:hypothetical protein